MTDTSGYLVGLIGSGIGPSLSPQLHQQEADSLGMRCLYRRLDLDGLGLPATAIGELLAAAHLTGFDGVNITHPCKQLAVEHLDELSPDATALNAVNTVVFDGEKAIGHNTDRSGFARALSLGLPDADLDRVVLLGAGGAGAAVAHALAALGAKRVHILDVDARRGAELAEAIDAHFADTHADSTPLHGGSVPEEVLATADGLVHATPTGMAELPGSLVAPESLCADTWVAEVVYRPLRTELVRIAESRGCRVLDGGRMAVFQAADAFQLFTGTEPDTARMLRRFTRLAGIENTDNHVHS
ncbi:shikimate dehydrogenase [Actinopolyspora halophila]|uniref:shikimate dehydrogenase n=1 Tax=Actinopolyspora halophila TaxID=1850 RepID=UPI00036DCC4D|nr:shikimate dehydrogenase [Actinopolyspora halophila]